VVARLFTVYGPGEHEGRLLPSLTAAADAGGDVELTEGLQKRDFTYAEDVAHGLLALGACPTSSGQIVNLATGRLLTVREFIERAGPVLGIDVSRLRFGAVSTRDDEMEHREVSVSLLESLIGWSPATGVADGVRSSQSFGNAEPSGAAGI
jgi:UDP-glucose 4-epimerase